MSNAFAAQRQTMVDCQIRPFSVADKRVIQAFADIPREAFAKPAQSGLAYLGEDLPMGQGRYLLEPSAYARLVQEMEIKSGDTVLDVGCLTGYTTCILASLAARVTGIDEPEWVAQAQKNTVAATFKNITFAEGAAHCAGAEVERYDAMLINGAVDFVPDQLTKFVKDGGRIGTFTRLRSAGHAVLYRKHRGTLHRQVLFDAFVPALPGFTKEADFQL